MNKSAKKPAPAIKPADKTAKSAVDKSANPPDKSAKPPDKSAKPPDKSAKSADDKSAKPADKSAKSSDKSTSIKSTAQSSTSEDRSCFAEEIAPEENPNCQCLVDCNCVRLRTSETVCDEDDGPGICIDFQPQHLVIDFTPTEELETAANVEACLRLWEMLAKVPQWAKALGSEASVSPSNGSPRSETEEVPETSDQERDHMAVSILKLMDKAGMTVPVFEPKDKAPYCIDEQQDYFKVPSQVSSHHIPVRTSVMYNAEGRPSIKIEKPKPKKPVNVKSMVFHLDSWDDCHPKSMEPPGHPPETSSMILERRKKKHGPCHRECKGCDHYKCDKDCGCHIIGK